VSSATAASYGTRRGGAAGYALCRSRAVDDRALGGHRGAETVHLERSALGDEGSDKARHSEQRQHLPGDLGIVLIGLFVPPAIEVQVHPSQAALFVHQE